MQINSRYNFSRELNNQYNNYRSNYYQNNGNQNNRNQNNGYQRNGYQNNSYQSNEYQSNDNQMNDNQMYDDRMNDNQMNDNRVIGAMIRGGQLAPNINGIVTFQEVTGGTQITATIYGLPDYQPAQGDQAPIGPFGFHIHEHGNCSNNDPSSSFNQSGGHWNPTNQPHGNHAGDLPVLFSNHGFSHMTFFTDKFQPSDVIGKSVIIHQNPDDYRTEPAGNSGNRIACGVIDYIQVK